MTCIKVSALRATERGGRMVVRVRFTNQNNNDRAMSYRFKWLDKAHVMQAASRSLAAEVSTQLSSRCGASRRRAKQAARPANRSMQRPRPRCASLSKVEKAAVPQPRSPKVRRRNHKNFCAGP
ncbi:DUF1425 domain-containing protein [Ralstonia sp. UBA689]|uniref:DUF1425 domain-containing protein n=1 Tax=Ralstonia sp. UBA689 TaxID=1947373 RepID=UPI0025DC76F0|nr:DUF1425 domain-containing protein [Ralstonia sp. UBA689]